MTDNDDDGESAAGGRLGHLLQILVCFCLCIDIPQAILISITVGCE